MPSSEAQMIGYYAFVIGSDGHMTNRVEIRCEDDEEAKRCAKQLVDGHAIELWQEARMIARFEPR
jgi:hypothetical protein